MNKQAKANGMAAPAAQRRDKSKRLLSILIDKAGLTVKWGLFEASGRYFWREVARW